MAKKPKIDMTAINISRCPKPLKEALADYAARKGRSMAAQCVILLWEKVEELGLVAKGGGGNRTRSLKPVGAL